MSHKTKAITTTITKKTTVMTTTNLIWHKADETPDHDCSVLVLCEWNHLGQPFTIFTVDAKRGKFVRFCEYRVICWAEVDLGKIKNDITTSFDPEWVEFLNNNIKNL